MAPKLKQGLTVAAAVGAAAIGGTAMAGATGDRSNQLPRTDGRRLRRLATTGQGAAGRDAARPR